MNLQTIKVLSGKRYDELAELTTTTRQNIMVYFSKNKLDIMNDEDFDNYKKKVLSGTLKVGRPTKK